MLEPGSEQASRSPIARSPARGCRTKLGEAQDAARRGQWREALRLALAVVAARKDFPGAAALVADARVALAPKPKPKPAPTQAPVVAAPPDTGGSTTPTTPPQPPPP